MDLAGIGLFGFIVGLTIIAMPIALVGFFTLLWAVISILRNQKKAQKHNGQA